MIATRFVAKQDGGQDSAYGLLRPTTHPSSHQKGVNFVASCSGVLPGIAIVFCSYLKPRTDFYRCFAAKIGKLSRPF